MAIHGHTGPLVAATPATYVAVHGTPGQLDLMVDLLDRLTHVAIGVLPQPCPNDLDCGCHFMEVALHGAVTAEEIRDTWQAAIAARN